MAEDIAYRFTVRSCVYLPTAGRFTSLPYFTVNRFAIWKNAHGTFSPCDLSCRFLSRINKKTPYGRFFIYGGGHGTRTRGAVTPYSLSRRAP